MPYVFQEYPKWLYPAGRPAVIAATAHDEADFVQAWAAEEEVRAAAAKVAEEAAAANQSATDPKRGPGRPSNAELAARAAADPSSAS